METKFVCSRCGSMDIQIRQWVNPNTDEHHDWCDDDKNEECWCEDCQEITTWEAIEQ